MWHALQFQSTCRSVLVCQSRAGQWKDWKAHREAKKMFRQEVRRPGEAGPPAPTGVAVGVTLVLKRPR